MLKLSLLILLVISQVSERCYECDANKISNDVMSPYCPGRTLAACPSEQAFKLRSKIEGWLRDGSSEQQVRQKLIDSYGDEVRGAAYEGEFAILLWVTPALILVFGSFIISSYLAKKRKHPENDLFTGDELIKEIKDEH